MLHRQPEAALQHLNRAITLAPDSLAPRAIRITSYNVCYTKLLRAPRRGDERAPQADGGDRRPPDPPPHHGVITSYSIHYTKLYDDILVNNSGITRDGLFMRMSDEQWQQVLETNLGGAFRCCRAVARSMMKARYGRIVNVSSVRNNFV